jgi:hypothetical protein
MQLRIARLCLDCEEIHEQQQCPLCASESFALISRWVPAPDRRARPRPEVPNPRLDVYRALTEGDTRSNTTGRRWKQGMIGLTALGVIGWFMRPPRPRD